MGASSHQKRLPQTCACPRCAAPNGPGGGKRSTCPAPRRATPRRHQPRRGRAPPPAETGGAKIGGP
eukprot:11204325-Lingulodinium_polyedra.AAC.1